MIYKTQLRRKKAATSLASDLKRHGPKIAKQPLTFTASVPQGKLTCARSSTQSASANRKIAPSPPPANKISHFTAQDPSGSGN